MRPPKSVRDRLKDAGEWNPNPTPPPEFEVQDLGTRPLPTPGAFPQVFNPFQAQEELPSIEISIEDPFFEYAEMLDAILLEHSINREKARALGLDVKSIISRLLGASTVGLAMHLSETHNVQNGIKGYVKYPPPQLPRSMAEYIQNSGEFIGPDGRKWNLSDCTSTVLSLIRCGYMTLQTNNFDKHSSEVWLPIHNDDGHTSHIVACKLAKWFSRKGRFPNFDSMRKSVFSGDIPPDISCFLSDMEEVDSSIVAKCFTLYSTAQQFTDIFNDEVGIKTLAALELTWVDPNPRDLCYGFNGDVAANHVLKNWSVISTRYQCSFGVAFVEATRVGLTGTKSQVLRFLGDGLNWNATSFYPLSVNTKNVALVLGSPVVFQELPQRNRTSGFIPKLTNLKALLEEDLGSEGYG